MSFRIVRADITKIQADAIVNTANPKVSVGRGVDRAIYEAAGKEKLLAERTKIGRLEEGEVAITPAFDLPAKYIIHSSGPQWQGGDKNEEQVLRQCYTKSLQLAWENDCESIAFPLMATGTYRFPEKLGMEIALDAFWEFLEEHEMEITLVIFGSYAYKVSGQLFDEVQTFIDDKYVEDAYRTEYWKESENDTEKSDAGMELFRQPKDLEERLKQMYTNSFEKYLQQLIIEKGMKNSDVYTGANISKQYFSKMLKGQVKPSKEKVLALAIGLHLNQKEADELLKHAGYALSPVSQTDVVVEYFIQKKEYNVMKLDVVLFDYGLPTLSE